MTPPDRLAERLEQIPGSIEGDIREALRAYLSLLSRWNRVYNLTASRDERDLIDRHLVDSLLLLPYLPAGPVTDLGTGAGLPGIPLAIADRSRRFLLVDSNLKKVRFLRQCCAELGLSNVEPRHSRVEDLAPGVHQVLTARAYAGLDRLLELADRLLEPGGTLLAQKGESLEQEIAALPPERVRPLTVHELPSFSGTGKARLVVYHAPSNP